MENLNTMKKGFQEKIIPHLKCIHCIIHRQAINEKKVNPEQHQGLQNAPDMVI